MYYLLVSLIKTGLYLSTPFSAKSRKLIVGRQGVFKKLQEERARYEAPSAPRFWFHCASLGEFEQGRPVMEALRHQYPQCQIILTFFSPSGYEVRHDYAGADMVSYLPLDGRRNARRFVALIQPTMAFFIKYEFWYGYLQALQERNIPALSVSTLLLPTYTPFRWYGGVHRKMLHMMDHYFAQNATTTDLLQRLGISEVTLSGDTRFDRAAALCRHAEEVPIAAAFKQSECVLVIGSSWPEDMEILLPLVQEFVDEVKFIIAPHEIAEEEMARIEEAIPYKTVRYSQADESTVSNYRVLIIDNIGMLTSLYRYGDFAYVGGARGKGLHNILEPATFGMPIYFGNQRYQQSHEANELLKLGGAFTVDDTQELRHQFLLLYRDEEKRQAVSTITQQFVLDNTGATEKVVAYVKQYVDQRWKEK